MSGEKRFRSSTFGFNKDDVNNYIEKIVKEFENKLKEKNEEIISLKNQNSEIIAKYDTLSMRAGQIDNDREKIADVLIKAQSDAEKVMEEARASAETEKIRLEQILESEREKIVDVKEDLKKLRSSAIQVLHKYEGQIGSLIDED